MQPTKSGKRQTGGEAFQPFYARARLACARSEKSENIPARSFGNAAAAIMAALSVESAGVGKNTGHASPAARAAERRPALEATPPEIIRDRAPISSMQTAARRNSSSITVYWKEASRSEE